MIFPNPISLVPYFSVAHVSIEIRQPFASLNPHHLSLFPLPLFLWSFAMVQLKQITRNATFAWSPARGVPLIASGTIAGAVDASFSQDSELEVWDLDLDNTDTSAFELKPTAKVSTERKSKSLVLVR